MLKWWFSKNVNLCKKMQNLTFFENHSYYIFIISLVIFGLQRPTLSQIKALEILFWPCFIIFSPRINICRAIMSRSCILFLPSLKSCANIFCPTFWYCDDLTNCFLFFMNFCILGKRTDAYDFTKKEKLWIWYHFINRIFKFILSTFFWLTLYM